MASELVRKYIHYPVGWLGVKLCNFAQTRPCTNFEISNIRQYAQCMIAELRGEVVHYGRDRAEGVSPLVCWQRGKQVYRNGNHQRIQ